MTRIYCNGALEKDVQQRISAKFKNFEIIDLSTDSLRAMIFSTFSHFELPCVRRGDSFFNLKNC